MLHINICPGNLGIVVTVPEIAILVYSPKLGAGVDLGTRASLGDIGKTIAENYQLNLPAGRSFLRDLY